MSAMFMSDSARRVGVAAVLVAGICAAGVQAGPNFLGSQTPGVGDYPALATIGVDIPTTYDPIAKAFVFDGVVDVTFNVTGTIQIWRGGAVDSFVDPISGLTYGTSGDGLNAMRLEMVSVSNIVSSGSPTGAINSMTIGDGVANGSNDGAYFSTGGAAELAPDGSSASAFLNLFMQIDVSQPQIIIPSSFQSLLGLDPSYPIGPLSNTSVLHLESQIDAFPPVGIPFNQTGGPVNFFAPATHPLVQDLAALPAPYTRPASPMVFARFITTQITILPEPGSLALLALMGLGLIRRR